MCWVCTLFQEVFPLVLRFSPLTKTLVPGFFWLSLCKITWLTDWMIFWLISVIDWLIDWLQTCIGILSSIVLTAFALKRQDAKIWVQLKTLVVEGIYYRCKARIFQSHETKLDTFPNEIELETVHAGISLIFNSYISSCGSDHVTDLHQDLGNSPRSFLNTH